MLTSEYPDQSIVLSESSTTPRLLSHGLTQTQQKIFYRLLVDLFVDNPERKKSQATKGSDTNESISPSS